MPQGTGQAWKVFALREVLTVLYAPRARRDQDGDGLWVLLQCTGAQDLDWGQQIVKVTGQMWAKCPQGRDLEAGPPGGVLATPRWPGVPVRRHTGARLPSEESPLRKVLPGWAGQR